ncbi:MAG TPA: ATP-binding protein [Frankiaceae bacterium]|nr:ATP-binding protein [Frankiaceae bacterium]
MSAGGQGRSARLSLPANATSPSRARKFVVRTLTDWGVASVDDAALVVSELVTNALLHARTSMVVSLAEDGTDALRLSVADGSVAALQERHFSLESGTGRGLRLLDSIALEWGVDRRDDGKTVWCRLPVDGASAAYAGFDIDAVEAL